MKLVIVVRADLGMSPGKMVAQGAHAAMGSFDATSRTRRPECQAWVLEGQRKVVLRVDGEEELLRLEAGALRAGIGCYLVRDSGRTEVSPYAATALGLGPEVDQVLDALTGPLKLL